MDTRVAAYAVIIEHGRILLSHWRRDEMHGWTLPGGGLEPGEDPVSACVREVGEETGYEGRLEKLLGVDSRILVREYPEAGESAQLHTLRIVYQGSIIGGSLQHEVGGSSDEARWFPLAEVPQLKTLSLVNIALGLLERPQTDAGAILESRPQRS